MLVVALGHPKLGSRTPGLLCGARGCPQGHGSSWAPSWGRQESSGSVPVPVGSVGKEPPAQRGVRMAQGHGDSLGTLWDVGMM